MRTLLHLAARLYPAGWRSRYGLEFASLLDDLTPAWGDVLDVVRGGLHMQIRRSNVALMAAAFGIVGAIVAGATAFATPDRFESRGRFRLDHPPRASEPVRREYAVPELFFTAFSRANLAAVIEKHDLYASDRAGGQLRLDEVAERMRRNIAVVRNSESVFQVSFLQMCPLVVPPGSMRWRPSQIRVIRDFLICDSSGFSRNISELSSGGWSK